MDAETTALFALSVVVLVFLLVILALWIVSIVKPSASSSAYRFSGPTPCDQATTKFLTAFFDQTLNYVRAGRAAMVTGKPNQDMVKALVELDRLLHASTLSSERNAILGQFTQIAQLYVASRGNATDAIANLISRQYLDFARYAREDAAQVFASITLKWSQWIANQLKSGYDDNSLRTGLFASLPHLATHLCGS